MKADLRRRPTYGACALPRPLRAPIKLNWPDGTIFGHFGDFGSTVKKGKIAPGKEAKNDPKWPKWPKMAKNGHFCMDKTTPG